MNTWSRRGFLGGLSASVLLPRVGSAAETPLLKFGVLSDCHIRDEAGSTDRLVQIFRHLGDAGCRLVAITGDLCELGTLAELQRVADAWKSVFPVGVNARGETIELTCCWGNHDYHDASYFTGDDFVRKAIFTHKAEAWRILTGEPWTGEVMLKEVGGVSFVSVHWDHFTDDLEKFLAAHAAEIPSDRPVFLFQHSHPYRTCFGTWYVSNARRNREILLRHPNFFVMSGHSHISCGYDDALWQGGFVSMAAGCAGQPGGRRYEYNVRVPDAEAKAGAFRHMPPQEVGHTFQASVVTVWPARVVVSRFDFGSRLPLGADWDLPFPFAHDAAHPLRLAEAAPPPAFPAGATLAVEAVDGRRYPDAQPTRQVRLTFPCARATGAFGRVVDYRVVVTRERDGATVAERLVAQNGAALAESRMLDLPGACVFGVDELPTGEALRFAVTPLTAGGRAGAPLEAVMPRYGQLGGSGTLGARRRLVV